MPPTHNIINTVSALLHGIGKPAAAAQITLAALPANTARQDTSTRVSYIVCAGEAKIALLTVGDNLTSLRQNASLFASAYPEIACAELAHGTSDGYDLVLFEYFDGFTATQALEKPEFGVLGVHGVLTRLASQFEQAAQASTIERLQAEIDQLEQTVLAIPYWTPADKALLSSTLVPTARQIWSRLTPTRRVTNGDFTLNNILMDARGGIRVIDYEQVRETHFHTEDWLRLTYWNTPIPLSQYALTQVPDKQAAQLYLWFKQLAFEAKVIIPEKARADLVFWGQKIIHLLERETANLGKPLLCAGPSLLDNSSQVGIHGAAAVNYSKAQHLLRYIELDRIQYKHEILHLCDEINHQRKTVQLRDDKIRRMQTSWSWRSTAWLRAFRRTHIDPRFRTEEKPLPPLSPLPEIKHPPFPFAPTDFIKPTGLNLHYSITTPQYWSIKSDQEQLLVSGCVFTELPLEFKGIRALIADRIYMGTYGLARPGIAEKFLPHAYSAFTIDITIKKSDAQVVLEIEDEFGHWHPFFERSFLLPETRDLPQVGHNYAAWVQRYDTPSESEIDDLRLQDISVENPVLISVVMPVYNTPENFLRKAIESIRAQTYPYWELCIADDASTTPYIQPLLDQLSRADHRIKVCYRTTNGHISEASNSALALATGHYVTFLDHDDELRPHALHYIAQAIAGNPNAEILYSDEDKIDEQGNRFSPHFKPDWNPDLLTSQNYFCHLTVYKNEMMKKAGGFRQGYEGCQDWDLSLRISEIADPSKIIHIPRILYHWRAISGSTAGSLTAKQYTNDNARSALTDHFGRRNIKVQLTQIIGNHWRVRYPVPLPAPLVTLIIPTRNRRELLVKCVESILAKTKYPSFEFLIADNETDDPEQLAFYEKMKQAGRFSVLPSPGPFNFSAINNRAVQHARGEIIGLLNNDLEAMHEDWLDEMVAHAMRPEIGVVGAKLYYPDMTLQHAGVITGLGGVAGHAFKHFPRGEPGTPQFRPHVLHNVSAVTAACVILRKSVFQEVHGLDEDNLKVAFNDVDFCLRVQALGYRNLFTPFAEFIHHESASRGAEDSPEKITRFQKEIEFMKNRWGQQLLKDPAYNPNFSLDTEDFAYASPPRV